MCDITKDTFDNSEFFDDEDDYWSYEDNFCDECDLDFEECVCGCEYEVYCDICGAIEGMCSCSDEEDD